MLLNTAKGSIVKGTVKEVDAKAAIIDLGDGVDGTLRASELSRDRIEDARTILTVGEEIEAKFMGVDRKSRAIMLSSRPRTVMKSRRMMQDYGSEIFRSNNKSWGCAQAAHERGRGLVSRLTRGQVAYRTGHYWNGKSNPGWWKK